MLRMQGMTLDSMELRDTMHVSSQAFKSTPAVEGVDTYTHV